MNVSSSATVIPILMYHSVAVAPANVQLPSLYVSPAKFAWQMRVLRLLGLRGVSMSEAMPYLRGERSGRVAVLTFDDGYADNLENALPVLRRFGFSATCYVASGALGGHNSWDAAKLGIRKPIMTEEQLRGWIDAGMEVGAHTRSHPHLSRCSAAQIRDEVLGSREDLEQRIGREVRQFCYPYGDYDHRVLRSVREAGFAAATTTRRGRARPGDDLLQLRRVLIRGTETLYRFALKLLTPYEDRRGRGHEPVQEPQAPHRSASDTSPALRPD